MTVESVEFTARCDVCPYPDALWRSAREVDSSGMHGSPFVMHCGGCGAVLGVWTVASQAARRRGVEVSRAATNRRTA